MVLAVGEHYIKPLPDILLRASCPFGGGIGGCLEELCGLLSGATLILGALWGRTDVGQNDDRLKELVCEYRQMFLEEFPSTKCRTVQGTMPEGHHVCRPVVLVATRLLVDLIERTREDLPFSLS